MADKELPPLRVKLIGDDKSFRQMIARVNDSLTKLESRQITVNLSKAVADATALADKLNSVNMSVAFQQITATRGVLRDLAKVKLTDLGTEVNNIAKKFEKIDQAVKRIQQISINSALSGGGLFGKIGGIVSKVKGMFGKGAPATSAAATSTPSPADTAVMNPAQIKAVGESTAKRIKAEADAAARKTKAASDATVAQIKASGDAAVKQKKASADAAVKQTKASSDAAAKQTKAASDAAAKQTKAAADAAATQVRAAADAAATTRMAAANAAAVARKAAATEAVMKRKAMADVAAIQLKAAATAAGIQRKAAAEAAAIATKAAAVAAATTATAAATAPAKAAAVTTKAAATAAATTTKAAATAAATTTRAAATAAATQTRAAASAAATQTRADNHTRQTNSRIIQANNRNWRDEEAHRQRLRIADEIHQKRMRSKYYTTHPQAARQPSSAGGGGGGGLGQGLTSRADIYMHANAMRTLTQSGKGLLDLRVNLQYAEVGIRAFTGDAVKASQVMQEIKSHAEKTSFTRLGLSEAARNMMAYGLSAKDAISHIKMLGDVAGGNELRFERLSFAMSQIVSMGRLQGQELRQLTEQGFNPLETMSRYTGKSMLELKEMMEDGAISAAHVTEALKIETSAGGRFANMQKEMANSLGGVRSQLIETAQNIKVNLVEAIEGDLIAAMKTAIGYLKQFETYMQSPQGKIFVARMAEIAKTVFVAMLAFHSIGFAMASFMWFLQSIYSTGMRVFAVFRFISSAISLVVAVISSPFYLVIAGVLAAVAAILYFTGTITGPASLYSAFIELWGIVSWFFNAATGFFYNFGDNWAALSAWFGRNWKTIIGDMMEGTVRLVFAMIGNMQNMLRMVARLFVVFFAWLVKSYQSLFSGDLFNAMVDGFVRVFTWLEDKWKKFGDFVGKIWENLFDPAALYDVLMEGMGINETAQKMTDDIATTMEKGLFAGMDQVIKDEMSKMTTGLEDFQAKSEALPTMKLDVAQWPPPAAPPTLPDAGAYTGPGFKGMGGAGKDFKATEAMSASGSAYNKLLSEQAERMRSLRASPKQNPQVQQQVITNNLLKQLIQLTGGTPNIILQAAGVSTP